MRGEKNKTLRRIEKAIVGCQRGCDSERPAFPALPSPLRGRRVEVRGCGAVRRDSSAGVRAAPGPDTLLVLRKQRSSAVKAVKTGMGLGGLKGPFQPKSFCDSMWTQHRLVALGRSSRVGLSEGLCAACYIYRWDFCFLSVQAGDSCTNHTHVVLCVRCPRTGRQCSHHTLVRRLCTSVCIYTLIYRCPQQCWEGAELKAALLPPQCCQGDK